MTARHQRLAGMAVAAFAAIVLALAVMAVLPATYPHLAAPAWVAGGVAVVAWLFLIVVHEVVRGHFADLRLLRAGLEAAAFGQLPPQAMVSRFQADDDGLGHLARLIGQWTIQRQQQTAMPDRRLAAVLRALHDGVVVVTETGLISLVNAPGKAALTAASGGARVAVGGSIFAVVERDSLVAAMQRAARAEGKPVEASLALLDGSVLAARVVDFGEHRGAVLTLDAPVSAGGGEVELGLDLHDTPPVVAPASDDTLLAELPVVVLDTETTGLDAGRDAIVSVGAVLCHGRRLYRASVLDRLVDPGRAIPARATAVHGIDQAMVAGQPTIGQVLPELREMVSGRVVIGHQIGFDLALLHHAARRAGQDWPPPPRLDILLLSAALAPDEIGHEIDDQAARVGINISGRHTALGDALVTAELWLRLIPQLERAGVRTLGEARAFSRRAKGPLGRQREMGWDEDSQLKLGGRS